MISTSHRAFIAYLECPSCGTRYLPRDRHRAELLEHKPRWFRCLRCQKRVMSVGRFQQEHAADAEHV